MSPTRIDHISFDSTMILTIDIDGFPHELNTLTDLSTRALGSETPRPEQTQPIFLQAVTPFAARHAGTHTGLTPNPVTEEALTATVDTARREWDRNGRHEPLTNAITRAVLALLNAHPETAPVDRNPFETATEPPTCTWWGLSCGFIGV